MDGTASGSTTLEVPRPDASPSPRPKPLPTAPAARGRRTAFASTRIRIVVTYLLVLVVAAVVAMIAIREVLLLRLDRRTEAALRQEVVEAPLLVDDVDPETGAGFTSLRRAFDVYLDANIPSIEEAFVALVDGEVTRDRLRTFPGRAIPDDALAVWQDFSRERSGPDELSGSFKTNDGVARYRAVRVELGDETGAFVVAILPAGELAGIGELQTFGTAVIVVVVLAAGVCAWFLAGRVLRPVRELTETAQSISEWDQTERLHVDGSGEAAEMAATFNAMLDRLEAVSADERDLFYAAGHELRAPLTVASGHLELLANGMIDQRATLPLVLDELTRMGKIIDDLQSLTGALAPGFLVPAPIDADVFAHELLSKATSLASRDWRLDGAPPGMFVADRFRLTEAVLNLADNAVAHTAPDDTIGIGLAFDGDDVRLWVRDSGIGMSPADADHAFERFARGRDAHRRYRGSGLGLSIVRSIAEAHGGRVDLESTPRQGTTVAIIIPAMSPAAPDGSDDVADSDR